VGAAIDRIVDPSQPSDPSVVEVRRSYLEEQYPAFVRNNRLRASDLGHLREEAAVLGRRPLISVLLPVTGAEERWLGRTFDSVARQVYPHWEVRVCCEGSAGEGARGILSRYERLDGRIKVTYLEQDASMAALSNAALSAAGGEYACLLGEGDELSPDALFEVAKALQEECPEADLLYSDEDAIDGGGRRFAPHFKPGWSPDLLLSFDYVSDLAVYRRGLLEELGGFREGLGGAEGHDLVLRATERAGRIVHLPKVLYHRRKTANLPGFSDEVGAREGTRRALSETLTRRGVEGSVEEGLLPGTFRVRRKILGEPKVSILLPTKNHAELLKSCIGSIEKLTEYPNYEILIIDNGSTEPATLEYLEKTPHRVVPFREQYNHPKINNMATSLADGEYVLLLNDDTEVISGGWLGAMLELAQRPEVGAVGARLLYPDGRVQHAGVVTTAAAWSLGVATHAYQFYPPEAAGHLGTLATTTNYSAVTAACMMVRKAVYEEVGGLDENLRVSFDDVDLCLRIRERGYLVVYTPYAELYHYESATLGVGVDRPSEVYMRERWEGKLDADPYYNPNFSKGIGDFNLRADLLRPRVLRQEPEDPASPSNGRLLTSPEVRQMTQEEIEEYLEVQRRATRGSSRTALLPREGARIAGSAVLESLEGEEISIVQEARKLKPGGTVRAEQLLWVFGSPRTGSTWLSKMMAELDDHERWNEPYVGLLFGSFIHERLGGAPKLLSNPNFILSERYRGVWLASIRGFVLDGASARYPSLGQDAYLIVKEPNGSVGASVLMEALPESRMVFLMRDPRDVVASRLDATRRGGWTGQERDLSTPERLNAFTRHLAEDYLASVSQVEAAYEAHSPGRKAFVRYEELRADAVGVLGAIYAELGMEVDAPQLEAAAAEHGWENIPESEKGEGKFHRKATPGGWEEDLTPEQVRIVEEVTAGVLLRYYQEGYHPEAPSISGAGPQTLSG
jgi:GT2 family glycosyltransferase